jgi:hypothetical protein
MAEFPEKFRLYRLSDFAKLPAMRWFIKDLVPRYGITLLYGEAKIGKKTFLGLSIACAIATGTDWCGFPTIKGTVLYIGGEGFFGLLRRQAAWEQLHDIKAGDGLRFLRVPINFFDEDEVKAALAALKAQGFKPDFVVIDTLARSMSGGKENATEDMSTVFEHMDFFRAELLGQHVQEFWGDVGMTIIHHTGKDGLEYRGSSVIKGAVDALIVAKAEDLEITVTSKGYKDAADFETFTVRCESVEVETEDGPEQVLAVKERVDFQASAKPTKEEEDLATMSRVLICLGNKATYTRWFEEVHRWTAPKGESKDGNAKEGWSETTFRRKLSKLKELGHVTGGENQGDCYSVVLDEAKRSRGVQPGEGLGGEGERAGSEESTVTNNRPATPFQGGGGGGGSFLDRHEPPNHRRGGSGGGSRNDGNASKPVVPNDQNDVLATIGAAMQQVKKAEGER